MVTKQADIIAGLERLGLHVEVTGTKVPEWKRIHVHQVLRERTEEQVPLMRYICKISIHHGMLHSYNFKGMPDYYCYAIKLMLNKAKILSMINYYALGVQAYNATIHLKEKADKILTDKSKYRPQKELQKLHHKAMLHYHWEKQKLFTSLFTERYYGGQPQPSGNVGYDL